MSKGQSFRAGAGAIILNEDNQVLLFERTDSDNQWQFPQGGLDADEEPYPAILREIEEETGITKTDLAHLPIEPQLLVYEFPANIREHHNIRGQVQYWYFFRFMGPPSAITLGDQEEFKAWRWGTMTEAVVGIVGFKKPVYEALAQTLGSAS